MGSRVYACHPEEIKKGTPPKHHRLFEKTFYEFWCILIDSFLTKIAFEWYDCVLFQVGTFNDRCLNPPTIKLAIGNGGISTAGRGLVLWPCHASEFHLSLVLPAWKKNIGIHGIHGTTIPTAYAKCELSTWLFRLGTDQLSDRGALKMFKVFLSASKWPILPFEQLLQASQLDASLYRVSGRVSWRGYLGSFCQTTSSLNQVSHTKKSQRLYASN